MGRNRWGWLAAALGAGIAVFLVLALALKWSFVLSALLGVGVYAALSLLLTPKPDKGTVFFAGRPDGAELAALMDEAGRDLKDIRRVVAQITDINTQKEAQALAEVGERIYRYLLDQPDKIPAARRFLTYYLDTVGRVLGQYVKFQAAQLRTPEVTAFQRKVRALLPKLRAGFEAQLNQLMAAERFDAEADMAVMEQLLETEGLECR